jgi:hypothetical protein
VFAYDSRAHGESDAAACTYGFYEKQDLSRALDRLGGGPVLALKALLRNQAFREAYSAGRRNLRCRDPRRRLLGRHLLAAPLYPCHLRSRPAPG